MSLILPFELKNSSWKLLFTNTRSSLLAAFGVAYPLPVNYTALAMEKSKGEKPAKEPTCQLILIHYYVILVWIQITQFVFNFGNNSINEEQHGSEFMKLAFCDAESRKLHMTNFRVSWTGKIVITGLFEIPYRHLHLLQIKNSQNGNCRNTGFCYSSRDISPNAAHKNFILNKKAFQSKVRHPSDT